MQIGSTATFNISLNEATAERPEKGASDGSSTSLGWLGVPQGFCFLPWAGLGKTGCGAGKVCVSPGNGDDASSFAWTARESIRTPGRNRLVLPTRESHITCWAGVEAKQVCWLLRTSALGCFNPALSWALGRTTSKSSLQPQSCYSAKNFKARSYQPRTHSDIEKTNSIYAHIYMLYVFFLYMHLVEKVMT